jgi:DNA-binding GntR family transcriptional regulator
VSSPRASSPRPDPRIYVRIANDLQEQVDKGTLMDGERLPVIDTIREQYGCSRDTVQQAMSELARRGYAERVPGLGWFVMVPQR